jgi:transforming growth factor-beta-induced protein
MLPSTNYIRRILSLFLVPMALMITLSACGDDDPVSNGPDPDPEPELNLAETLAEDSDYSTLVSLVPAQLLDALEADELTVFAPTNTAFENIPAEVLESLTDEEITLIITYHLVAGTIMSGDVPQQGDVETVQGEHILVQSGNGVTINGSSEVVDADITASNGVVHGINEVLLPSDIRKALGATNIIDTAEEAGGFEILLDAVESAGLKTTLQFLGPFTAFAPSDEAFGALPDGTLDNLSAEELTSILTYHVVDGAVMSTDLTAQQSVPSLQGDHIFIEVNGEVVINANSSVISADIEATNGVIHAVDAVLFPDAFGTIVDNAVKRYDFSTLVGAVTDADLAEALMADGPFTVFAPTNEAFNNLPDGLLESLTMEQITDILLYHVIEGDIKSGDLDAQQTVSALNGESVYVTANGGVTVNGNSGVVAADVDASNGTIHAIDQVLIPNSLLNIVEIAQKNYELTTLVDLVINAELAGTLSGEGPFTVFAPVNAAFEDISEALEGLSDDQVAETLTYHVIPDRIESGDIPAGETMIETVNGQSVTINNSNGTVTVDGATVITVDLAGTNGVIHLIDTVILPDFN